MGEKTGIAWTDSTWNPVRGCTKVSAGCKNCYAETFAERWRGIPGHAFAQGFDLRLVPEALELPLRWKKPRRVFVNSMSDLFHEGVPDEFIDLVFAVMALAPQHTFQVLTKRQARMRAFLSAAKQELYGRLNEAARQVTGRGGIAILPTQRHGMVEDRWPLPNVWLGVSVEDQCSADERIPELLATPAAVRFLSCEPLLGPVDLGHLYGGVSIGKAVDVTVDALAGRYAAAWHGRRTQPGPLDSACSHVDWVIVGGESGPGARPCDIAWVRNLVRQCKAAGVPAFVKQLGADPIMEPGPLPWPCEDRAGRDPAEWPPDLRVRAWPTDGGAVERTATGGRMNDGSRARPKDGRHAPEAREFLQGLAAGLAFIARDEDQPSMATDALLSMGVSLTDLQKAGVDEFDLAPLSAAWDALPPSRQR